MAGILDSLTNPLSANLSDPTGYVKNQGLLGLASGLLQASAPSPRPVNLGAAFGQGIQGMQAAQANATKQQLEAQKISSGANLPNAVQEWNFLKQQFPNMPLTFENYLSMKRGMYTVKDVNGVPTLIPQMPPGADTWTAAGAPTGTPPASPAIPQAGPSGQAPPVAPSPSGINLAMPPKQPRVAIQPLSSVQSEAAGQSKIQEARSQAQAYGTKTGTELSHYKDMLAKMPQVYTMTQKLHELGQKATYTNVGKGLNYLRKEAGMQPLPGAVARTQYMSYVRNTVLPELKRTFGGNMTVVEGEKLESTLGDPNLTPQEKDAALQSFIDAQINEMKTSAARVGQPVPETQQGPGMGVPDETKTVNGITYERYGSKWYQK